MCGSRTPFLLGQQRAVEDRLAIVDVGKRVPIAADGEVRRLGLVLEIDQEITSHVLLFELPGAFRLLDGRRYYDPVGRAVTGRACVAAPGPVCCGVAPDPPAWGMSPPTAAARPTNAAKPGRIVRFIFRSFQPWPFAYRPRILCCTQNSRRHPCCRNPCI